jgi:superfamily II DNA or RNA helicase
MPTTLTTLRPYQEKAIQMLRESIRKGFNRHILCAPTGAGKTVMFTFMVSNALLRGLRCMIFTDRIELLKQADGSLAKFDINPVLIEPKNRNIETDAPCYIAMAQTLMRRKDNPDYVEIMKAMDIVIIDEAHKQTFNGLLDLIPETAIVIGATATPMRKGNQECLSRFYQKLHEPVSVAELIDSGYLSQPLTYGLPMDLKGIGMKAGDYDPNQVAQRFTERKVYEGVVRNYRTFCPDRKAILFASNIASSMEACDALVAEGYDARHVDGTMPSKKREEVLAWFKNSANGILCNCDLMTTGYDEPTIEVVILYRATTSLPLFMQMVGRGSRVTETKNKFWILDFGNNVNHHGLWEAFKPWSLKKKRKREGGVQPMKLCPQCQAMLAVFTKSCPGCGYEFQVKEEQQKKETVHLQLLTPGQIRQLVLAPGDIARKVQLVKSKQAKPSYVLHQLRTRAEGIEFIRQMGYKPGWLFHNAKLYKCFQS